MRIAAVAVPWRGGSVLAGRSLREVEQRVDDTFQLVLVWWGIALVALLATALIGARAWPARASDP